MGKTLNFKKALLYVLLPFIIGILVRTYMLNAGEQKIVLYKTFQPTFSIEIAQN